MTTIIYSVLYFPLVVAVVGLLMLKNRINWL